MGIDGAGVTTLVAGAGCPLKCRWCINKDLLQHGTVEHISPEDLLGRVKIDDLYFRATGGGITFGGGEPLLHAAFISSFRKICPPEWRINAETSLQVPGESVKLASEAVDTFIVDCKDMDEERYRRYTGASCAQMSDNLRLLLETVGPDRILVRVPHIPHYNTVRDQSANAALLRSMGFEQLDLFDYVIR